MNNRDQHTDRHRQHGFMLFVTCVLSFAAFMFAVDLSALGDEACRNTPKNMAAQQVADAPAIPARQQSTPAPQPMRAVLAEAVAAKTKATYPDGNGAGLSASPNELAFFDTKHVEAASATRFLRLSRSTYASVRAPPLRA
ncbi:hypothetical protein ACNSPG_09480 [Brucella pituitosa]|uniref:hypothetical protein n=1 Tax=Brucella pituitosa TaxID=571256 RepID=UPI003C77DB2E